jgi:hypothetical protein
MAFGLIYPRFTASRTFHLEQGELRAVVGSALQELRWQYKPLWDTEFHARVPITNWSWRHDVQVRILPGGVIQAESRSTYREVFFDFGRNRRNVETFFARVEQIAARPARGSS